MTRDATPVTDGPGIWDLILALIEGQTIKLTVAGEVREFLVSSLKVPEFLVTSLKVPDSALRQTARRKEFEINLISTSGAEKWWGLYSPQHRSGHLLQERSE